MQNEIRICPSALKGQVSLSRSAFLSDPSENNPFSFNDVLDVFKSNDTASDAVITSPSTSASGSGVGLSIFNGIFGVLGGLAPLASELGIGSNSRINETNATAAANAQVYNAQTQSTLATIEADKAKAKDTETMLMLGFGAVFLIVVIAGALFIKR